MNSRTNGKHTPGPWQTLAVRGRTIIGDGILICDMAGSDDSIERQKANAARIVACVNACENFTTQELQERGQLHVQLDQAQRWAADYLAERDAIRADNARLREALQAVVDYEAGALHGEFGETLYEKARAALALGAK